ncbi:MAG TPA: hypothetical protein VFK48_08475 [Usitatibacter sp.]|nr:hypothetical protein [Usitatibacter sp.]
MGRNDDIEKAQAMYEKTANDPPVDPRKPPGNLEPGSHSTGGRKDHAQPDEGDGMEGPGGVDGDAGGDGSGE